MEITVQENTIHETNSGCTLPLLLPWSETGNIAYYKGRMVSYDTFLSHVQQVTRILPEHQFCINLCDDRYHFLVVFTACVVTGQVSLLPGSRAENEIARLQLNYEDSYLVDDQVIAEICQETAGITSKLDAGYKINADQAVAILFTSGSTGLPKANFKTWRQLVESAKRVRKRLGLSKTKQHSVIATVPPQHMFGFETTIIYALLSGVVIYAGRPFYPLDIQDAISKMPAPQVLITTPIHLETCATVTDGWEPVEFVLSATAMMPTDVASNAERIMNTVVKEIYGCSEAGVVATRRTTTDKDWQLLEDYTLNTINNETHLSVPAYPEDIVLPDILNMKDSRYFLFTGRTTDIIKIGGKRGSLADITLKLKGLRGVEDAICIMPEETKSRRLIALVVAPRRDIAELRRELSQFIDSVFLPRPFIKVDELPYNELGKLPREAVLKIIQDYQHDRKKDV